MPTQNRARTARERARADIMREIVETGRRHLAQQGASGLSLRAVARDLGMVSSALYRYVGGRDELLTLLIVEAYDSLGDAVDAADAAADRTDLRGRWLAACAAVRGWALEHPHEYALIYGSPVPGYAAPADTVGPAVRVPTLLITLIFEGVLSGVIDRRDAAPLPGRVAAALEPLRAAVPDDVDDDLLLRGLLAWTYLFGAVSFEVFGHLHAVVAQDPERRREYFAEVSGRLADDVGMPGGRRCGPG